ncbi:MAG TPA: 2OG-Fe(II) oxygenase [Nevskia sp.]|nr:2OG-Fe(II) oxygenase [Nevskia sp.]
MNTAEIIYPLEVDSLKIDANISKSIGQTHHRAYTHAKPFKYIKLDNFLAPEILRRVLADFPSSSSPLDQIYMRAQERLKLSYKPDLLPDYTRSLFFFFNSAPFIAFLEALTGIRGLIPDAHFVGGGLHEVRNGGHLDIHADFNHHAAINCERRINVLIYLNEDWKSEYGGQFEIWSRDMKSKMASFDPAFNRCVIFNTSSDSYHGNPNPVNHPEGRSRKSIALYYYTATWDGTRRSHTTQFKARPMSSDRFDWGIKVPEFFSEILPPFIFRVLYRWSRSVMKRVRYVVEYSKSK